MINSLQAVSSWLECKQVNLVILVPPCHHHVSVAVVPFAPFLKLESDIRYYSEV